MAPATGDSSDWYTLVNGIITGASYHASLVALAARLVGSRMHDGTAVKLLRAIMSASTAPHDAVRWQARFDAIPRIVSSAREKYQRDDAPPVGPLPFIDMQPWDSTAAPSRPWAVTDRIPINQPTLFSGEGAAGKTLVELQLCVAHVTGRDWLGGMPEPGPAIYYGAEDDSDELHRRLTAIAEHYGVKFSDLIAGGLHLLSFAGADAVLAIPDRQGKVQPTPLFDRLLEAAGDIRPRHIGIDATADTFAGNEIDRSQVRQFVGLMRKLAIAANGSVVLLAHPSLTGISSGTGLSGSTAWHNSVRARMLLKTPSRDSNDDQSASDLRELSFLKNNYGPLAESIVLRFRNGLFLPEAGQSTLEKLARDQKVDETFLDVLGKLIKQNRPVSPSAHARRTMRRRSSPAIPTARPIRSAITGPRSSDCWRPTASISPASGRARKQSGTWHSDRPDRRRCDGPSHLPSYFFQLLPTWLFLPTWPYREEVGTKYLPSSPQARRATRLGWKIEAPRTPPAIGRTR